MNVSSRDIGDDDGDGKISDFGMRISEFVFGTLSYYRLAIETGNRPKTKSEIRIPKSEIVRRL